MWTNRLAPALEDGHTHSHVDAHREARLTLEHLWRSVDDENEVFVVFQVADLEKTRAFVSAPEVPDAQCDSGMIGRPDIYFVR